MSYIIYKRRLLRILWSSLWSIVIGGESIRMKGFAALSNRIGIDMGSSQVRIYQKDKMILAEASAVAVDNIDGHVLGFGTEALIHYHKAPENNCLEWPVQNGVIANYEMTKSMLRFFIKKSLHRSVSRPTVMIAIPGEISSVTRHALVDALIHAGSQKVYLLPAPAAAALGAGMELERPEAILSLVIGRDVTDGGIYSCGGIAAQESTAFGGHSIDVGICHYLQDQYQMMIGLDQAEKIKSDLISLSDRGENTFTVRGRRIRDGVEVVVELSLEEMSPVMQRMMQPVLQLMHRLLCKATPDMAKDLMKRGLLLSGGSALLNGLKDWLSMELGIPVVVADRPGDVVALGCYEAFEKYKQLPFLIENGEKYYGGA